MSSSAAVVAKEKGNAAFKAADYVAAVGHYTAAALADPSDPTFFLNRAAAYLKLLKNEDAERDCTTVLSLSNKNVKAFFRRAQARAALNKLGEAHNDLQRALRIEPNNEAVKAELARVDGLIVEGKGKTRSAPIEIPTPPPTSTTAEHPKRRRVPITIVDDDTPSPSTKTEPTNKNDLLNVISSRVLPAAPPDSKSTSSGVAAGEKPKPTSFKEAKQVRDEKQSAGRVGGGIFRVSGNDTVFKTRQVPAPADTVEPPQAKKLNAASGEQPPTLAPPTPQPQPAVTTPVPTATSAAELRAPVTAPPRTLFEFTRAWDRIPASDTGARWDLLNTIPPRSLPAYFGASLEPAFLSSLIPVLAAAVASPDAVREYMYALTRVPRFKTVVQFLSRVEQDAAHAVWDAVVWGCRGGRGCTCVGV
ncbi:hypothetical protein BGW80DRAFT_1247768 [Lactifluus volemus]|nr:hypothetical protein BGW80DRAFT_1247768 [Lactifluus volemus]